jgi:hypothetical protein
MIRIRRLPALGAICVGALWLASAPASAITISVGGDAPTVPITLPVPASGSVTLGGADPLAVDVQAPGSTGVSVEAGPTGLHAKATAAAKPLVNVDLGSPSFAVPAPIADSLPIGASPVPAGDAPPSSPAPGDSTSGVSAGPKGHGSVTPGTPVGGPVATAQREISAVHRVAGDQSSSVSATIASSPRSGILAALPGVAARMLLWIALAGAVIAMRLFFGSSHRATRAS